MSYLIKHVFQKNRELKSKCVQHDYRSKGIANIKKHVLCEYKCKFDGKKCYSNQKWNNDKCRLLV